MNNLNKIIIFTDGSSRGNPGPGGWGSIILSGNRVEEIGGREDHTTNNRMELKSVIEAMKKISVADFNKDNPEITVYSDSQYVIKGITEWIQGWINKGWRNSQKKAVLNRDLWEELLEVTSSKKISWKYVAGHSDVVGNERCDVIATDFADKKSNNLYSGTLENYFVKNLLRGI